MEKRQPLENFCGQHRAKFIQLQEAAEHVTFQVPNEHTRVGYLIDNIENTDADLKAAVALIRNDTTKRSSFEQAVTTVVAVDPYVKHASEKKSQRNFTISGLSSKSTGRGSKTGVDLRWHKTVEFQALSKDEKDELREWQQSKDGQDLSLIHI